MRQFIRFLLIPGFIGWILGGCSEKIEPKPPTYSQLLTGTDKKTWKMVSFQVIDAGNASGVIPVNQSNIAPCIYDDYLTFYANSERKFEASEGPTKCSASDPDLYLTDTWTLVNANATLEFYIPVLNGKYPWIIKNLTSTSMTVQYYFQDIDASYQFTFTPVTTK
ncbi:lipocalin family protein [Spirosoma panaciterrae]|uniref:lipocalin family protein n=1 Tax=Spirosoma panaciterrae TaxID=496058 RepID=UPI0004755BB7|nr:lipocalin family protein [Spirosoma panaciterrae]